MPTIVPFPAPRAALAPPADAVSVRSAPLPGRPATTVHWITARDHAAVQAEVARIMAEVDVTNGGVPGQADFFGPFRMPDGAYEAKGVVTVFAGG